MRALQPDASYNHLVSPLCANSKIFVFTLLYIGFNVNLAKLWTSSDVSLVMLNEHGLISDRMLKMICKGFVVI